jgi:hypothetical protein
MTFYELTIGGDLAESTGTNSDSLSPSSFYSSRTLSSIMTDQDQADPERLIETDFFELPIPLLRKALDTLIKKGKAQVFTGTEGEDGDGVKFM